MKVQYLLFIVTLVFADTLQLRPYTYYPNCHQRWGNEFVGFSQTDKICDSASGSLVSCLAMILQFHSTQIGRGAANPKTVNQFLKESGGFSDKNIISYSALNQLNTVKYEETNGVKRIKKLFDEGMEVILNLNNPKNYVVLLGYRENDPSTLDDDVYYVHDPTNSKNTKIAAKQIVVGVVFRPLK